MLHRSQPLWLALLLSASPVLAQSFDAVPQRAPGQPLAPGFFVRVIDRVSGLSTPIAVVNAGDGSGRLFALEQGGRIRIWNGTQLLPTPFLDISGLITGGPGTEQGLLGLAFHPDYETNGFFYVNYTCRGTAPACSGGGFSGGDAVIARYRVSANANVADPASAQVMIVVDDPFSNHNGGNLAFGPDGYLYIGLGDGGSGGDQCEYAQNLNWEFTPPSPGGGCIATTRANRRAFWGKMLRIDVNQNMTASPFYGIPSSNPYTILNDPSDLIPDEIWAYGLRNPWRYSFDRLTGDLYVGDVGQNTREEITMLPAPLATARNFGWDVLEGFFCHENVPAGSCNTFLNGGSLLPALDYGRGEGSTVIGGYVYRGRPRSLALTGHYVFADLGSGHVWHTVPAATAPWPKVLLFDSAAGPTSFGESEVGGLFMVGMFNGHLYQIQPYSFGDVPPEHFAWRFVEPLFEGEISSGCGGDNFCPEATTSRGEMAVFLLRTKLGTNYVPPACSNPTFADVPCSNIYADWIYDLVARGVTAGCGNGNYCPTGAVSRDQMAVFLLRTLDPALDPPACTTPVFGDVPASSPFCRWVEELARRGITGGCGNGNFCPGQPVTRAQMAIFLVTTFSLKPIP
jgi:glucose/arabinose dehydrogenase